MRLADSADTTSNPRGDLGRFVEGRARVFGSTLRLPRDPDEVPAALAEMLGGRGMAKGWALAVLDAFDNDERYWIDHHGNRVRNW